MARQLLTRQRPNLKPCLRRASLPALFQGNHAPTGKFFQASKKFPCAGHHVVVPIPLQLRNEIALVGYPLLALADVSLRFFVDRFHDVQNGPRF